jgi:hypothetical protein
MLPLQGFYQGNGAGPAIWLIISSNLLNIMRKLHFGAFYKAAISGDELRLAGFSYVDDTDLMQSASPEAITTEDILSRMQKGLDSWEGLIRATGGALVNEKSRWWFIDFSFTNNGDWKYKTTAELDGELTAVDIDGKRKPIQRLEFNQPFETLGVKLDPTGSDDAIISDMYQWTQDWGAKIRRSYLHEHEVHTALQMTIQKKLEYPLIVINPPPADVRQDYATGSQDGAS